MRFTRIALALSFNLVIGFIVVPGSHQVNHKSKTNHQQQLQLADGMPLPPLPPNVNNNSLSADGMPLPPLPPNAVGTTLLADGMPLPPLPPNADGTTLMADGMPLPPLPPNMNGTAAVA